MHSGFLKEKLIINYLTLNIRKKRRTYTRVPIDFFIPKYSNTATKQG